jgi:cation:H+ antiporter
MDFFRLFLQPHLVDQFVTGLATWVVLVAIAACIVILTKGADLMVSGAVNLASLTNLSEIFIGATIISLGTTLPEVCVSVFSAWSGDSALALGNGIGSVICNTGLILGITCIVARVPADSFILDRTGYILTGAGTLIVLVSVMAYLKAPNAPVLHRWVGILFLILLAGYLYLSYQWSKKIESGRDPAPRAIQGRSIASALLHTVVGLCGVIIGGRLLIPCAAAAAVHMGVSQDIIAATLVSLGTSLPELATAIVAIRKGHPQIMVGNVIGADILSCLFVFGAAAASGTLQVTPNFFRFHFPALLLILYSFRFFVSINKDGWFKRIQGVWIFGVYLAYIFLQYRFAVTR